jgi:hypothetical protein
MLVNGFRMAADLTGLPIVVAGPDADQLDREALGLLRADGYVPAPVDGATLAGRVGEVVRAPTLPPVRRPARQVALGLVGVALLSMVLQLLLGAFQVRLRGAVISLGTEWVLFVTLALVAWAAWAWLGPRAKPRTPRVRRAFLVLAGALVLLAAAPWAMLPWVRL